MQTVVYNSPLYYCCPLYIECILLSNYYRITIILLLFSSRTSEGSTGSFLVLINSISSSFNITRSYDINTPSIDSNSKYDLN